MAFPHGPSAPVISSRAAAETLAGGLSTLLCVVYTPMDDAVARLDTSREQWVLHLDPASPAVDQCWAMLEVLEIVVLGTQAAGWAKPAVRRRVVED